MNKIEIIPTPFEEEFPEAAQELMALCQQRAKAKAKGKKLKPLVLDPTALTPPLEPEEFMYELSPSHFISQEKIEPFVRDTQKVGRNDLCPCGSSKKFKKCCG